MKPSSCETEEVNHQKKFRQPRITNNNNGVSEYKDEERRKKKGLDMS